MAISVTAETVASGHQYTLKGEKVMNTSHVSDIAFTPAVKEVQRQQGSRKNYEKMAQRGSWSEEVDEMLADFIAQRDSVYLGTASAEGRPYIQHRGGAKRVCEGVRPEDTGLC